MAAASLPPPPSVASSACGVSVRACVRLCLLLATTPPSLGGRVDGQHCETNNTAVVSWNVFENCAKLTDIAAAPLFLSFYAHKKVVAKSSSL